MEHQPELSLIKTPRVLIDGYFLHKPYGFGRFIGELCRALGNAPGDNDFIVAVPSRIDVGALPSYAGLQWRSVPDANFIVWEQWVMPRLARQLACDVIHFPYNTMALLTGSLATVVTVHDVLFLENLPSLRAPKDFVAARYAKLAFGAASRRANAVVSVSRTTERSLLELGVQARTVYNTVDGFTAEFSPAAKPSPSHPYVLHRGGYQPHRNTARVIKGFLQARQRCPGVVLKIIGAPAGAGRWAVEDEPCIEFLPRVSDHELATLYAGSACVVATSLEEGFGLPIIEGFGFGAPVITSDIDPMREVGGDAALLVDPHDADAIGRAIASILTDSTLKNTLVDKGRRRMSVFSSARVGEQMIEIYRFCAAGG